MNRQAQSIYAVTTGELDDEMNHIEVCESIQWLGSATVITGLRRYGSGEPQVVTIIKSAGIDSMHLICLSAGD